MYFIKHHFGGLELINLLANDKEKVRERMMASDAIFCFGGNTEYLKAVFDKTGFSGILPDLLETKIWCGSSAGSMVIGYMPSEKLSSDLWGGTPQASTDTYGIDKYLELVPLCILPHLYGGDLMRDSRDASVVENSTTMAVPIYALSDWSAVLVDGNETRVIGHDWSVLKNGEIIQKG